MQPKIAKIAKNEDSKKIGPTQKHQQNQWFFVGRQFFKNGLQARSVKKMWAKITQIAKISIQQKNGPTQKTLAKSMVFR